MKKNTFKQAEITILLVLLGVLLCVIPIQGCAPVMAQDSSAKILSDIGYRPNAPEWTKHSSLYYDWDHAWFSIIGYKYPYPQQINKSAFKTWWGDPVKVIEVKK